MLLIWIWVFYDHAIWNYNPLNIAELGISVFDEFCIPTWLVWSWLIYLNGIYRMDHTCHGKMYLPREAKGGFLDLQTCNCFLNGREQLNKWCCRLLNNTETFVDSDSGNIENKWCSLCGERSGWMTCGKCEGEGGFSTRPGLGGVKGKVRWALCKTCFGRKTIPCLLCGSQDLKTWQQSLKGANKD